ASAVPPNSSRPANTPEPSSSLAQLEEPRGRLGAEFDLLDHALERADQRVRELDLRVPGQHGAADLAVVAEAHALADAPDALDEGRAGQVHHQARAPVHVQRGRGSFRRAEPHEHRLLVAAAEALHDLDRDAERAPVAEATE